LLKLGKIKNDLTDDELQKLGIFVPPDPEDRKNKSGYFSQVQSLFYYYYANPVVFRKFESLMNYAAIAAGENIKKMTTFRGRLSLLTSCETLQQRLNISA
jgi:hypothetical protein